VPLFHLAWSTDSTPHILLHNCQKLGMSLKFFCQQAPSFWIGFFLEVHSTLVGI